MVMNAEAFRLKWRFLHFYSECWYDSGCVRVEDESFFSSVKAWLGIFIPYAALVVPTEQEIQQERPTLS